MTQQETKVVHWFLASQKHKKMCVVYCPELKAAKMLVKPNLLDVDTSVQRHLLKSYASDAHLKKLEERDRVEPMLAHVSYIQRAKILQEFIVEIKC